MNNTEKNIAKEKALAYFQNLYLIAVADGRLSPEETKFLVQYAHEIGISPRETTMIMSSIKNLDFIIPESEEEKMNQLEDIALMMLLDKKIDRKEYELCATYADMIGKGRMDLDRIIAKIAVNRD